MMRLRAVVVEPALWLLAASRLSGVRASELEVLPAALAADDACLAAEPGAGCSLELLQLRGVKKQAEASPAVVGETGGESFVGFPSLAQYEAYEAAVDDVIEDAFKGLRSFGGYLESTVHREDTWRVCTDIDWSRASEKRPKSLDQIMRDLNLDNACDSQTGVYRKDPTCISIQAAADAILRLQERFPSGPKFANYLLVDWGSHPSWRQGAVVVDNTVMPPNARVLDHNGANGYGFCDIVRTVLTQSPNQMQTGTCGFVASLAALSHAAPAKAIKMGVRLMWTGRPTRLVEPPCEYIFDLKPGLVPFMDEQGMVRPEAFTNASFFGCSGNRVDCQVASGRPLQNAGLTFMWSQSLIASFGRALTGSCPKDGPAKLNYPGLSLEGQQNISSVQGQTAGSSLWACNAVIDPQGKTCDIVFNHDICGRLGDNECQLLMTYQIDGLEKRLLDDEVLDTVDEMTNYVGEVSAIRQMFFASKAKFMKTIHQVVSNVARRLSPAARKYGVFMEKLLNGAGIDAFFVTINVFTPSANEAILAKACRQPVAMLAVDATPLQGNAAADPTRPLQGPFDWGGGTGRCNHMVYLEKCDPRNNTYTLWTWGTRRYVTKELLLGEPTSAVGTYVAPRNEHTFNTGMVCFATFAKQISWAPVRGDPHLGSSD